MCVQLVCCTACSVVVCLACCHLCCCSACCRRCASTCWDYRGRFSFLLVSSSNKSLFSSVFLSCSFFSRVCTNSALVRRKILIGCVSDALAPVMRPGSNMSFCCSRVYRYDMVFLGTDVSVFGCVRVGNWSRLCSSVRLLLQGQPPPGIPQ